ncbi:MAG: AMP-binding protein [Desulfobacterales bacterium]|nr:AMP-binding protein [Desulfobacterales bacterium]MDX2513067.1 AMP-binding protein [Desulfobacterales bacterium]
MTAWMNLGQQLKLNASKYPDTIAIADEDRQYTFPETNQRVNKLCHSLLSLGLRKGDKVAVFMENSIEIVEIFLATAKTGLVIVPINFRLVGREVSYIVNNSDAKAFIVDNEFTPMIDGIKGDLKAIPPSNYIVVGKADHGYQAYEPFIEKSPDHEPVSDVAPKDTWILIYTSGTTGKPKGVVRSHESHIAFFLINAIDFGFDEHDVCLNVMPLCHINSTFFTFTFTYVGATVYIHPARSFKPQQILGIIEKQKITFISLIPTHYNLILNIAEQAQKYDVSSIRKLLCSSAPVHKKMKLDIMDFFQGVDLYEAYGSTEAGIVTVLKPENQLRKLGSIGKESLGTDFIKILDENGNEVVSGEVGELYSRGPMLFDEYYKLPDKTKEAFQGEWFSAGDMARKDEDGFYQIVDRKDNMIITGGENVYPSEIEEVVGSQECVFDCAVIGIPDDKWGEKVVAVVIPRGSDNPEITEEMIVSCCKDQMAGYKRPKEILFIKEDEMPRTPTGKILHRKLREKFNK